jgi:hypothetical protein
MGLLLLFHRRRSNQCIFVPQGLTIELMLDYTGIHIILLNQIHSPPTTVKESTEEISLPGLEAFIADR